MAVPEVTCSADVILNVDTSTRLVQLGATATNTPTSYEWTVLAVPKDSTALSGAKGDFTDGVAAVQNPELEIDGLQSGDEVDGAYVIQCVASNAEGPSVPLLDRENGQQLIVVLTEGLELYLPNDYAWDWGKRYMNETLRILEERSVEVSVSANDQSRARLFDKLREGTRISLAEYDDGGDEQVEISVDAGGTLLELTDAPANYTGAENRYVKVNGTPDGIEFIEFNESFLSLSDTPSSLTGEAGKLVRVNGSENALEFLTNSFVTLPDTPASFVGQAAKILQVNSTPDALEFADFVFLGLTDTPASFAGNAKRALRVKEAEDGVEFTTITGLMVQGEDELDPASTVGTETELVFTETPVAATGRPSGLAVDVYRNGILMRYVATLGADKDEWTYTSNKAQFVASGTSGDRYVAVYWYVP